MIVDGSMVVLSPELAALLRALADLPAEPIRRTELARAAWPHAPVASRHTVDRRVCALQAALGPHSWLIEPVPGCGYQLSVARG